MRLINPNIITHRGSVSEEDLRHRMAMEALAEAGWLDQDGRPIKACSWKVSRGSGRAGGYTIEVSRDLQLSDQARLTGPEIRK